jgi:hypothetical protein
MVAKLGVYQSGDWEKKYGSRDIMQKEVASRKGRNPQVIRVVTEISEVVDIRNNWWSDDTEKLQAVGADGNLELLYDRHDQPRVFYEGFAPEGYLFDEIEFSPWLTAPVAFDGSVQ